jgi:hypothetical protein
MGCCWTLGLVPERGNKLCLKVPKHQDLDIQKMMFNANFIRRSSLIENIIASLVVASITGLTFLAYTHPETYKYIDQPVEVIWFFVSTATVFYHIGYTKALTYAGDAYPQALKDRPDFGLIVMVSLGAYLYLKLLKHGVTRLKSSGKESANEK